MEINEAIEALRLSDGIEISGKPKRVCEFTQALDKAMAALKFQQEYQYQKAKDFNDTVDACQQGFNTRVQKCIERIDRCIENTYYNSVSGSIADGNKNTAYHNCKNIIKEEMGVEE